VTQEEALLCDRDRAAHRIAELALEIRRMEMRRPQPPYTPDHSAFRKWETDYLRTKAQHARAVDVYAEIEDRAEIAATA
jgi:hypothetical protein